MSICNPQFELPEQLGYVQCSFCTTILLVSVPSSSLLKMVTVRCGHCTGLLSVSLTAARTSFLPLQVLASLQDDLKVNQELCGDAAREAWNDVGNEGEKEGGSTEAEEKEKESSPTPSAPVLVNKPPEKRQRAPSAYNRFIKEEIQRIKNRDPTITHKEAFSTAAKNWAHFPRIPPKGDGESCSVSGEGKKTSGGHLDDDQQFVHA